MVGVLGNRSGLSTHQGFNLDTFCPETQGAKDDPS